MLQKIKLMLGITSTDKDELIQALIDQAVDYAAVYTRNPDCIGEISSTIVAMVVYLYSRLDSVALESENYSGISFSYQTDYPEDIQRVLKKYRKLLVF